MVTALAGLTMKGLKMQIKKADWQIEEEHMAKMDRINHKHNAKELKRAKARNWYSWFAWHPVKLMDGQIVVFEWVKKRRLNDKLREKQWTTSMPSWKKEVQYMKPASFENEEDDLE